MNIKYDFQARILEVDGRRYLHVEEPAYHAFLSSESRPYHLKKYIEPVYLWEETDKCVMDGGH